MCSVKSVQYISYPIFFPTNYYAQKIFLFSISLLSKDLLSSKNITSVSYMPNKIWNILYTSPTTSYFIFIFSIVQSKQKMQGYF